MVVVSRLNASKRREGGKEGERKGSGWGRGEKSKQNKLIKDASKPETPGVTSLAGYTDSENKKHSDGARDKEESKGYGERRGVGERWRSSSSGGVIPGVSRAPGCQ